MKNTKLVAKDVSPIALRLFYNSLPAESGKHYSLIEQRVFTTSQLYQDNSIYELSLNNIVIAKICYVDEILTVLSDYKVDIELCGNILANSLFIKTLGAVRLANATSVNLKDKILIISPTIIIDVPKINNNMIRLESTPNSNGAITLNFPIVTKNLEVKSHKFTVNQYLFANNAHIIAVKTYISADAKILNIKPGSLNTFNTFASTNNAANDTATPSSLERSALKNTATIQPDNRIKFFIECEEIICKGDLDLNNATLKCTTLSLTGMFITLRFTQVYAKKLRIGLNSNVTGNSVYFKCENDVEIDGSCKIDRLRLDTKKLNVTGLLWDLGSLELHIETYINNTGVLGSDDITYIFEKPYIFTTALRANQVVREGIFLNGAIVGRNMLYIDGLATIVFAGGCLYGRIIKQKNGLYANILGMRVAYTRLNYSLISFSKFSLNIPFTIDAFSMTDNFDAFCDILSGNSEISMYDAALLLNNISPFASLLPLAKNLIDFLDNATAEDCLEYCKKIGNNFIAEFKATVKLINELRQGNITSEHIKQIVDRLLAVAGYVIQTKTIISNGLQIIESLQNDIPHYINMFENIDFEKTLQYPTHVYMDFLIDKAKNFAHNSLVLFAPNSVDASLLHLAFDVSVEGTARQISLINLSNGVSFALSSSVEALAIHNLCKNIYAYKHSEAALATRDSSSKIFTDSLSIMSDNNIERGTIQTIHLLIRARNIIIANNSNITAQDTSIIVETRLNSNGTLTLGRGSLIVKGQAVFSVNSTTNTKNLDMFYRGNVNREGQENFDNSKLTIDGNNTTSESLTAIHRNTDEHITGASNDNGNVQKFGGKKIVRKVQEYGKNSKFVVHNAALLYLHNLQNSGVQQLNDSSVYVRNDETNTSSAVTEYNQTPSTVTGDYVESGTLKMQRSYKKVGGGVTLTSESTPALKDVSFECGNGFTDHSTQGTFENVVILDKKLIQLDASSKTEASNLQLIAPNVSIDGEVTYSNAFHIEAGHVSSSQDSKIERKPLADSTFSLIADTIDMKGQETHLNDFEIINNISTSAARDQALSERKTIENSISVTWEDDSTYEYLGGRKDNAHVSINTNGLVALPAKYNRANGKTFAGYEEAEAFVMYSYGTYNLPPEPKKKRTIWRKIGDEVTKATAKTLANFGGYVSVTLSCIPGCQIAGAVVGAAAIGANIALDKREKRKIEQQAVRELKAAYEQKLIQQSTLTSEEKAILEMLTREEHFAKIQDARNRVFETNFDGELQQIESLFVETRSNIAQEFALLQQNISDIHHEKVSNIIYSKQHRIDTINSRKHSIGVGVSSNIGSTGYDVNLTVTNYTKEGRSLTSKIEVYKKNTYRAPSIAVPETPPSNRDTAQDNHGSLDFPEMPIPDVPILTSPTETINSRPILHSEPAWQPESINHTLNAGLFNEPLLFGNDADLTDDHNVNYAPAPAPEKSKLRKFLELFEGDEYFHTEFYDVKITPELRAGRAFVTRSIVRNTKESIIAMYNIHTYVELSTMAWDGINEISNEVFGVASQASLERNQQRLQNMQTAWQAFKDADGETKSYILLDLTIGITTGMLTGRGVAGVDKFVNKMLAHHALPPLLKQIKKDLEKVQKTSDTFKKTQRARESANNAASLPVLSAISSEATYINPIRELAEAAGKPIKSAAAISSTSARTILTGNATGELATSAAAISSTPARDVLTGAAAAKPVSAVTTSSMPAARTILTGAATTAITSSTIASNRLLPSLLEQSADNLFKQPLMFSQGRLASYLNQSLANTSATIKGPVDHLAISRFEDLPVINLPVPKPIKSPFAHLKPPPPIIYNAFKNSLTNPKQREKIGLTNPLIQPHTAWNEVDYLSQFDYMNPVPLTHHELEMVNQWMFERKRLLDKWAIEDISSVNPKLRAIFKTFNNQLRDHMQPGDLCAIIKEKKGVEIFTKEGKLLDHIDEWYGAKKTINDAFETFKKYPWDGAGYGIAANRISDIIKAQDRYEKFMTIGGKKCIMGL